MNAKTLIATVLLSLSSVACGGSDAFLEPSAVDDVTAIRGLLRQHEGAFVEHATETFEAIYDAPTVRAPEWSVSGGNLMGNGSTAKWTLPKAGRHSISMKVFLNDGRELSATWTIDVSPRGE